MEFDLNEIKQSIFKALSDIEKITSLDDKIDMINSIKTEMSKYSPFNKEPIDCVLWVPSDQVQANDYNPNTVASPEMRLLQLSIMSDGYTQPIVTWGKDVSTNNSYEIVDGFHRNKVGKSVGYIKKRIHNRLPISIINSDRTSKEDRMAATIRHNRARGVHSVDSMSDIVMDLAKRNWSDEKISKELGMEPDEVLRLKQETGLLELFSDKEFSTAWEWQEDQNNE